MAAAELVIHPWPGQELRKTAYPAHSNWPIINSNRPEAAHDQLPYSWHSSAKHLSAHDNE
jgi:hypothetical protein